METLEINKISTWVVFAGFIWIGLIAGIFIGAWVATTNDVIAQAEKIAMEALND